MAFVSVAFAAEIPAYPKPSYSSEPTYEKKSYDYVGLFNLFTIRRVIRAKFH